MQFPIGMDVMSFRVLVTRFAAITTLVFLLAACGQEPTTSERIEQALDHRIDGDVRSAIIELRRVLQEEPKNAEARLLLGITYLDANQMESAEKELRRARELGIPSARLAVPLGRALLEQRKYVDVLNGIQVEESWPAGVRADVVGLQARALVARDDLLDAQRSIERAVGIDSESLQTGIARVELALARSRLGAAVSQARNVTEMYPESGLAWRASYRAMWANGDMEGAESAASRAIEIMATPAVDRLFRARLRVASGNLDGARTDLDAIGNRLQKNPRVRFVRALIAWAEEDYELACSRLQDVVSDAPRLADARYFLGACLFRSGEYNQAESHLNWVYQRSREPRVARLLGLVHLENDEPELARDVLDPVLKRDPDDVASLALLGRVEMELGNTTEAIRHLQRVAELRPDDASARLGLGAGLLRIGQIDAGQQALEKALSLDSESESAGIVLVISHLRNGKYDIAMETARRLAEEEPDAALPWTLIAVVYLAKDDVSAARDALNEATQRVPADPAARHYLARLEMQSGNVDAARTHFEAVLEDDPSHVQTLIALASLEARNGKPAEARDLLMQAHQVDPGALPPRILLGQDRLARNDPTGALEIIAEADGTVAQHPQALEVAGRAHLVLEQSDRAVEMLTRLTELAPESEGALLLLARAHEAVGDPNAAVEQVRKVLKLNPDHALAQVFLARAHGREGRYDDALEVLARVPDEFEGEPLMLETRAGLALGMGEPAKAARLYRQALAQEPKAETAIRLARALRKSGDTEAAMSVLENWLDEHPQDADAWLTIADLHFVRSKESQATAAYRRVLDLEPQTVAAMNNLAWLLRREDPEAALALAEEAVALQPGSASVRDTLGIVLMESGRNEEAVTHLRAAVSQSPDNPSLHYHLAKALNASGAHQEARDHLRRALSSDTPFPERAEARALLSGLE